MSASRIYLASRSPRRRELLLQIGVPFDVLQFREANQRGLDVDETPLSGESPDAYVRRVTLEKARVGQELLMARRLVPQPVLAADTTVVCDDAILGKPRDREEALAMLGRLSGRSHRVLTAVAIVDPTAVEMALSESSVTFRELQPDEMHRYTQTPEPMDKAGAYAIQGLAAIFVTRIEGSYSGIMGLPLAETAVLLSRFGIRLP